MLDEVSYRARPVTGHSIASSAVKESDLRTPKTSCSGTTYTHLIPAQGRPASGSSKPGKLYSGWQYCYCTDLRQQHVTALPAIERWGCSFLYTDTAEPPMLALHARQCSRTYITYQAFSVCQAAERAKSLKETVSTECSPMAEDCGASCGTNCRISQSFSWVVAKIMSSVFANLSCPCGYLNTQLNVSDSSSKPDQCGGQS